MDEIPAIIEKTPYYKSTSNDVDWVSKVKMQGRIQKWVDHSISVTINLPKDATEELVGQLYVTAWENGCKGVTVYREGSRTGVLVSNKKGKKTGEQSTNRRPKVLKAEITMLNKARKQQIKYFGELLSFLRVRLQLTNRFPSKYKLF